jgi:membrane-bound lytic murein transglycosylase D
MRPACTILLAFALPGCALMRGTEPTPEPPVSVPGTVPPVVTAPAPSRQLACITHPRIDLWERRLRTERSHGSIQRSLERGRPYLPELQRILAESNLPPSLALLPVVESGFRRHARGRFGDRGLWQLRPPTARRFGLVVTRQRDDRLHPYHATRAAARYLRLLRHRYDDWPLALAAYNAGERRVDRALEAKPGGTFWELADAGKLPRTSRDYVPHFLALVRVVEGVAACPETPRHETATAAPDATPPAGARRPAPVQPRSRSVLVRISCTSSTFGPANISLGGRLEWASAKSGLCVQATKSSKLRHHVFTS